MVFVSLRPMLRLKKRSKETRYNIKEKYDIEKRNSNMVFFYFSSHNEDLKQKREIISHATDSDMKVLTISKGKNEKLNKYNIQKVLAETSKKILLIWMNDEKSQII